MDVDPESPGFTRLSPRNSLVFSLSLHRFLQFFCLRSVENNSVFLIFIYFNRKKHADGFRLFRNFTVSEKFSCLGREEEADEFLVFTW